MRYLILISIILCCICCYAQDSKALRYFEIGLGANHISLQDQVFSPLVYRRAGFLLDAKYINQKRKRSHNINMGISSQELVPVINPQGSGRVGNSNFYLNYEYLRSFSPGRKHNLGIGLYNFASVRTFFFLVSNESSADLFSSLNLVYTYRQSLKEKHHISASVSLPIMAYILGRMRVPRDSSEDVFQSMVENPNNTLSEILVSGDFLAFNKFLDIRFRLEYLYDLSQITGLGFTYSFQYYTYPKFETVKYGASQYVFRWVSKF